MKVRVICEFLLEVYSVALGSRKKESFGGVRLALLIGCWQRSLRPKLWNVPGSLQGQIHWRPGGSEARADGNLYSDDSEMRFVDEQEADAETTINPKWFSYTNSHRSW